MESKLEKYKPLMEAALDRAKSNDVYAIVRLQDANSLVIPIRDGETETIAENPKKGIGVSVFTKDGACGFASTAKLNETDVKKAVDMASQLAKASLDCESVKLNTEIFDVPALNEVSLQPVNHHMGEKSTEEIEEIVKGLNKETKTLDDRVTVESMLFLAEEEWRIMRTDGTDVIYNMPRSLFATTLTLKEGDNISQLKYKVKGIDLGVVLNGASLELYRKRSVNQIKFLSDHIKAGILEGGHYKSLLSHEFGGLFVHEAVGHAFETDQMKVSIVGKEGKVRLGEKVAPANISFVDGPVEGYWGNQFISDNGVLRNTVEFIKNGVIVDALSDVYSAKETGVGINGCGRAQTYENLPICRMSATRMVDNNPIPFPKSFDDVTPEDIYNLLVEHGELNPGEKVVYPVIGCGGSVNPVDGKFMFSCTGIYVLENPKKITLYRQSAFSGNIMGTIATRARGIGEVMVDETGMCGKLNQLASCSIGGNMFFVVDKTDYITFGGKQ